MPPPLLDIYSEFNELSKYLRQIESDESSPLAAVAQQSLHILKVNYEQHVNHVTVSAVSILSKCTRSNMDASAPLESLTDTDREVEDVGTNLKAMQFIYEFR